MTETEIEALARLALKAELPKEDWTHEAHFALALWCIRNRPDLSEPDTFRGLILGLNRFHGTENTDHSGYHHTITVASLDVARLVSQPDVPLHHLLDTITGGPYGKSGWILKFWSKEKLFSVGARRDWVEPDLAPWPPGGED